MFYLISYDGPAPMLP